MADRRTATLIRTQNTPLGVIDADARLRPVSDAAVAALIDSIEQIGFMKDEVHLRKMPKGRFRLIAGGHRLAAAGKMGWADIPSKIWDCTADWATLLEIDDNLAHAELDPLELSVFLAERKRVYEKLYPQAGRGGDRKSADFKNQTDIMSFCSSVAQKRDLTERHIRRLVAIGTRLTPDQVSHLRVAGKSPSFKELQALAKAQPEERDSAVEMFGAGDAPSLAAAIKAAINKEPVPVKDPVETAFQQLLQVYARAPMAARRRFAEHKSEELSKLIADMRGTA